MSDNVKSLSLYKADKTGEETVESIVSHLYAAMEQGRVKDVVFAAIDSETGELVHACNQMDAFKAIGMLDTAKDLIKSDLMGE